MQFLCFAPQTVRSRVVPAAVFVAAFAPELVGWENGENAFFWAEILPFNSRVWLQIISKNWKLDRKNDKWRRVMKGGQTWSHV